MFRVINGIVDIDDKEYMVNVRNDESVKHEPYVDEKGIWYPIYEYTPKEIGTNYKLLISKEMFVEAYNKWIKGE